MNEIELEKKIDLMDKKINEIKEQVLAIHGLIFLINRKYIEKM